jgi:hypothetical protein
MAKEKQIISYEGVNFDSHEEMYMYWWLTELKKKGVIESIEAHPESFILSDDVTVKYIKPMARVEDKVLEYTVINKHVYTADFKVKWNVAAVGLFCYIFPGQGVYKDKKLFSLIACNQDLVSYIEVKPIFDQNNMTRLARNTIKWVYDKYHILVELVIPEVLFNKSFTPQRFLFQNKANGNRKIKYKNIVMIEDFLKQKAIDNLPTKKEPEQLGLF